MSAGDWKAMLKAITEGNEGLVRYYLDEGVDPNYEHPEMLCTPILEAIRADHASIIVLLIEYGADANRKSAYEGVNAYQAIAKWNKAHLLEYLPKRSALSAIKDRFF